MTLLQTNTPCRAQESPGLKFMCDFVGSIADDHVTKEIKSSMNCSDVIIQENGSGSRVSVMSDKVVKDTASRQYCGGQLHWRMWGDGGWRRPKGKHLLLQQTLARRTFPALVQLRAHSALLHADSPFSRIRSHIMAQSWLHPHALHRQFDGHSAPHRARPRSEPRQYNTTEAPLRHCAEYFWLPGRLTSLHISMCLDDRAQLEERKYIEGMKVVEMIDRKMIEGEMDHHQQWKSWGIKRPSTMGRSPKNPRAWMAWTASTTRPRLGYASGKDKDHAVVDVRCAYTRHSDSRESAQQSGLQLAGSHCTRCNTVSETCVESEKLRRLSSHSIGLWESRFVSERSRHGASSREWNGSWLGRPTRWTHYLWSKTRYNPTTSLGTPTATGRQIGRNARPQWRAGEILVGTTKRLLHYRRGTANFTLRWQLEWSGPHRSTRRRQDAEARSMIDREPNQELLPTPPGWEGHLKKTYGTIRLRRAWPDQRVHRLKSSANGDPSTRPPSTMPRETEELLQGSAQDQQRMEAAERRALDVVGECAAKRTRARFADRRADAAISCSAPAGAVSSSSTVPEEGISSSAAARDDAGYSHSHQRWRKQTQWRTQRTGASEETVHREARHGDGGHEREQHLLQEWNWRMTMATQVLTCPASRCSFPRGQFFRRSIMHW